MSSQNKSSSAIRILSITLGLVLTISLSPLLSTAYLQVPAALFAASPFEINDIQQQTKEPVTTLENKDVVEMVKMGLSNDVIAAKIKTSLTNFDTSPAAMKDLKFANVPDEVILAMVQAPSLPNKIAESDARTGPALVYVYRHKNFNSRNMHPSVYVDGAEVAQMDDGKFFIIKLDPGKHTVEVNKGHSGAEIDMKAGEPYYFRVEIIPGFWKGRGQIDFIQKEQGALELKKMKPLESKWIKDKRITVEDVKLTARG